MQITYLNTAFSILCIITLYHLYLWNEQSRYQNARNFFEFSSYPTMLHINTKTTNI